MTLTNVLILSSLLFAIGLYGTYTRRNLIGILMSIEIMINASVINFVAFAYFGGGDGTAGSVFSVFIIAVSACEMSVALAIAVSMYRQHKNLDVRELDRLNG